MPSWIGPWEIAIVLVLALLIFGPKKLPDLGASLGRSISGFKKGLKESQDELKTAMQDDVTVDSDASTAPAEPAAKAETATTAQATATDTAAKAESAATDKAAKTGAADQS